MGQLGIAFSMPNLDLRYIRQQAFFINHFLKGRYDLTNHCIGQWIWIYGTSFLNLVKGMKSYTALFMDLG